MAQQWRSCGLNIGPLGIDGLQNNVKKLIFAKKTGRKFTDFTTESLCKMPKNGLLNAAVLAVGAIEGASPMLQRRCQHHHTS